MADATEVAQARDYIRVFCTHTIPGTTWVDTTKRRIQLDDMSDEEALFVASEFQRWEAEAAALGRKRRRVQ